MKEKAFELLKIFDDNGYEAYIIGGFVRDFILGKESFDIDIATNATPREIKAIFGGVKLPLEGYGSVFLSYKKINFEITTYRMELEYQNKRKPTKILYTDKLIIDLRRRDFTMNSLCMDKDGNIIDNINAMEDINKKLIKCVGRADKKLKEDALRILRAIRFATELDFELDIELQNAIIDNKEGLNELSYYRKKQELNRIFSSPNRLRGIELLKSFCLDKYLDISLDKNIVDTSEPIGMWAQVSPSDNYQFTNNEKDYLEAISRVLEDNEINDIELYKEGNYVCYIASEILNMDNKDIYERYDALPIKSPADIDINGKEIIELLSLEDKSMVKIILNDIEEKIILRKLKNIKNEIKKYVVNTYYKGL